MTTESWATRIRHDSDAAFQEWRDELITKLGLFVSAGVLAADETNVTTGAGARPGTNAEQSYAVYHLNDALHATDPIYIRFGFGTGSGTTTPRINVGVGTSTNGSGVLGGTASATGLAIGNTGNSAHTADTARTSYMSGGAGYFGLSYKVGANSEGCFLLCRSFGTGGTPNGDGAFAHWGSGSASTFNSRIHLNFDGSAVVGTTTTITTGAVTVNPPNIDSSAVGTDTQALLCFMATPRIRPMFPFCGLIASEVAAPTTFALDWLDGNSHTFIALSNLASPPGPIAATATGGTRWAMLWE